jgi:hypothetical protein
MYMKMDIKEFENPGQGYRGMPFWSLNGNLDKNELIRQVGVVKSMGFGGFFMHSRTGLATEYMGEEWFAYTRLCAAEAKKLGLQVYLYDEDRWPSGTAGGMVTKNPHYRQKFISMDLIRAADFDLKNYGQEYIASFAARLEGAVMTDYYPVTDVFEIRSGYDALVFYVEEGKKSDFYNGYTYLDVMNRDAVGRYIELTHERYKAACGDLFGKEIIGIFTDEPHRGCAFGGAGITNENAENMAPYTYKLFSEFEARFGYSLRDRLPELYYQFCGHDFSKTAYDYIELLQQLFLENFAIPYQQWCEKNKLVVTGHILHEDSLSNHTAVSGSVMRYYEHMDYPGVDVLSEGNRNFWVAKQVYSVAKQLEKKYILSELYGCTGWQFRFEGHKQVGDWQAVMGINMRCHHLSWYTMKGQAKRDYPASIFHQSAWYDRYHYVEAYFARMGYALSCGTPVTDTLVINPIESVWGYVRKGCFAHLEGNTPQIKEVEEKYRAQFKALTDAGVDFDYADEDILSRRYRVDGDTLCVGAMRYKTVLISGLTTIRQTTLDILDKFSKSGGRVVWCGVPGYIDALPAKIQPGGIATACVEAAAARCAERAEIKLGCSKRGLLSHVRRLSKDDYIAVIVNTDTTADAGDVELSFSRSLYVEEYNLRTGASMPYDGNIGKNETKMTVSFAKGQERMFRFTKKKPDSIAPEPSADSALYHLPDALRYTLSEPNVMVLDIADYYIDGKYEGENDILRIDRAVRTRYGLPLRSGGMVQPWYRKKYGDGVVLDKGTVKLAYKFNVRAMPPRVSLVCEQPESFAIAVNGTAVNERTDTFYIDNCFSVLSIPESALRIGENELTLECTFNENINLEAVYLIGEFGVKVDGTKAAIVNLPKALGEGSLQEQGLPFYGGKITLYTGLKAGKAGLRFTHINAAYIEADYGKEKEMLCFSPYTARLRPISGELAFSICLTRRNMFGPLHLAQPIQPYYGPMSFETEGEQYSYAYTFCEERIDFPTITVER